MKEIFNNRVGILCALFLVIVSSSVFAADQAQKPVKNAIVLVMDGTAWGHITIARWYKGAPLNLDRALVGAAKTYSEGSIVTDSAAAATALGCGHKTQNGFIGILSAAQGYKPVASVLEAAKAAGKSVGVVVTCEIPHATPAGFTAHSVSRGEMNQIAEQQVYSNLDVVFAGGKSYLLPSAKGGSRADGEDLFEVLKKRGYTFVENRDQMLKTTSTKVWGLFAPGPLAYDFDRAKFCPQEPSLPEMVQKAIDLLSQNKEKGFFLMVEGSKIDWASHDHDPIGIISDLLAYDEAVGHALAFAEKDGQTLVIAVPDHDNGAMSIMTGSKDQLVGTLKKAKYAAGTVRGMIGQEKDDAKVRQILAENYGLDNMTAEEFAEFKKNPSIMGTIMSNRAGIGWSGTFGHIGDDVPFYAYGPNRPVGLVENTDIPRLAAQAMGLDLTKFDQEQFIPVDKVFNVETRWMTRIDQSDKTNPVLIVENKTVHAKLPIDKNYVMIGNKVHEFQGVTVYIPQTGCAYIPRQAVRLIQAAFMEP